MILTRKRILWVSLGVALVTVLVVLLRPAPLPLDTAVVAVGALQETVDEQGQTRVRDRYVLAAPVTGRVLRIGLEEGETVSRDQVLARMYSAPLDVAARQQALAHVALAEDAARAASAIVEQARAALAQARRELQRAQDLHASGMIAEEQLEQAQLAAATRQRDLESADFRAQAAAHDVEAARAAAREGTSRAILLRSPAAGQVLRIPERSERVVSAGETLLEIGDPSRLEIVADLLSSEAVRVHPGDSVLVEGWGGVPLRAVLRTVEPSGFTKVSALGVEEQRVNVVADLVDRPSGLGDRFRVELRIVVWCGTVRQAPASAVFRQGDGWAVFTVESGRARLRPIEVGHRTPFAVEIVKGLESGTVVIHDPGDRVADGVRVKPVRR
jgi:HlyD family secretion protein